MKTLQSAACCVWRVCVHRHRSLLASQFRLHTSSWGRSPLGSCKAMQAASALDSCGSSHPAELERHSSASYTLNGAEAAGPLDMPPSLRLGPRVEHVKVPRDGSSMELLPEALDLPQVGLPNLLCNAESRPVCYSCIATGDCITPIVVLPCAGLCSEANTFWCSVLLPHSPTAAAAGYHGHSRRSTAGRRCSSSPASRRSAPWQGCACRL